MEGQIRDILPGELGHSLQEPGGVAVQRHGAGLEAAPCAQLSPPPLLPPREPRGAHQLATVTLTTPWPEANMHNKYTLSSPWSY